MSEEELDRLSDNYFKNLSKSIRHRMRIELSMLEQHRTKKDTAMNDLNFDGLTESQLRLFAVRCARRVQNLMTDPRSLAALDVAERYERGEATDDELSAAWNASAAGAAAAAVAAVGAAATWSITAAASNTAAVAAWELAWVAEREAQQKILDEIK